MNRFSNKQMGFITSFDMKKIHIKLLYWLSFVLLCVMVVICFFPPLWVMLSSMKDLEEFFAIPPTLLPKTFHPEKLIETWDKLKFWQYYINSFAVIAGCVCCAVVFNGMLAYVVSKLKPRGSKIVFNMVLWSMMIPGIMGLVPLFNNIVNMSMINTYLPLWLVAGANAFYILLYKNFYDGIPQALVEAARIDGCSDRGIFFRIILPISRAINVVVIIFAINAGWSDFLLPFLVLKSSSMYTVMVKIFTISTGNAGFAADQQFIAITFAIIPPTIMYIFFQRQIIGGMASGSVKG